MIETNINIEDDRFYDVENYWGDLVPIMVTEEAGELFQAISKYERFLKTDEGDLNDYVARSEEDVLMFNMEKEISDLFTIIGALIKRYNLDTIQIKKFMNEKLNRKY